MEYVKLDWTYACCSALTGATVAAAAAVAGFACSHPQYRIAASRTTSRSRSPALGCLESVHRWRARRSEGDSRRKVKCGPSGNDKPHANSSKWSVRRSLRCDCSTETLPPSSASFTVSLHHFVLPKLILSEKRKQLSL